MKHHPSGARLLALSLTLALGLLIPALIRPTLAAQSYQNAATISFNGASASGPAALYPSPITVAGLERSITKVASTPATVNAGAPLAYDVTLRNRGTEPVANPLVSPAGWVCTNPAVGATGAISCTNDALDVMTDVLVLSVQLSGAPDGTAVALTASVQSPTVDGDPANNSAALNSVVVAPFVASCRCYGGRREGAHKGRPCYYSARVRASIRPAAPRRRSMARARSSAGR